MKRPKLRNVAQVSCSSVRALENAVVLIGDGNPFARRLIRMMLINVGLRSTHEASDGPAVLDAIERVAPTAIIMNWSLPVLDGPEVMRIIRSPGSFPKPNVPVIAMLECGVQSQVNAAIRLGAHEIVINPVSPSTLEQRLKSMLLAPRPMVRAGDYYVPQPRGASDLGDVFEETGAVC